jgi:hypothetical protein
MGMGFPEITEFCQQKGEIRIRQHPWRELPATKATPSIQWCIGTMYQIPGSIAAVVVV